MAKGPHGERWVVKLGFFMMKTAGMKDRVRLRGQTSAGSPPRDRAVLKPAQVYGSCSATGPQGPLVPREPLRRL